LLQRRDDLRFRVPAFRHLSFPFPSSEILYGFGRTQGSRSLELSLYHSLGKLPEPECTHDFF
jgi:hypothetical protein